VHANFVVVYIERGSSPPQGCRKVISHHHHKIFIWKILQHESPTRSLLAQRIIVHSAIFPTYNKGKKLPYMPGEIVVMFVEFGADSHQTNLTNFSIWIYQIGFTTI